jgi:hypothetical protein
MSWASDQEETSRDFATALASVLETLALDSDLECPALTSSAPTAMPE